MEQMTIRQMRLAKEISQEKMAEMLDIHVNTYIKWEKEPDKISVADAYKICGIFEVSPDLLIFLPKESTNM